MAAALLRSSVAASSSLRGMASGRLASGLMFRRSAPVAAATRSPLMVAAAAMHARHASGSASGHNDHHEKHDGYSTGDSTALWAIGSAMVFVPSVRRQPTQEKSLVAWSQ
ncbi:hypothetical protein BC828DRAFT_407538 [Blastocladiella britannica]|nr:hypothetical protein BC828DRAFT_407538 [Blastocladiella britannica]